MMVWWCSRPIRFTVVLANERTSAEYHFENIPERFKNPPCSKSDLSTQFGRFGSGCQLPLRHENWFRVDSAKVKPSSQKTWQISVPSDSIWQTVSAFSGGTKMGHRWADKCPRKNNPIWAFILILFLLVWVFVLKRGSKLTGLKYGWSKSGPGVLESEGHQRAPKIYHPFWLVRVLCLPRTVHFDPDNFGLIFGFVFNLSLFVFFYLFYFWLVKINQISLIICRIKILVIFSACTWDFST